MLPMTLLEGASEFVIHGGQFNHVTYQLGPHDSSGQSESPSLVSVLEGFMYSPCSPPVIRRLVEKDSSLNQYSVEHGTVTIPHFSKSLLLQDLQIDPDVGRLNGGSCSFDLLARLGLFPGQANEALAQYDTEVPLDAVVSRGNCYCGRISRHGFVFLVSKYFQHVSLAEATTGGTCFILLTTIGRFKCYEIDDRIFIHFDSGTRSSYMDLVENQNIDDILRTARGEYWVSLILFGPDPDKAFEWHRYTGESFENIATGHIHGVPKAVIYMTKSTLQTWSRIKEFAFVMLNTVLSVLDEVKEPAEFLSALRNPPPVDDDIQLRTPANKLVFSISLCRTLLGQNLSTKSCKGGFSDSSRIINQHSYFTDILILVTWMVRDMFEAHMYFRSNPRVELARLIKTSHQRFLQILNGFPTLDDLNGAGRRLGKEHIQKELLDLLHKNKNNVALVAIQGLLAVLSQWNADQALLRGREAPEEWIRFVGADDDELFIG